MNDVSAKWHALRADLSNYPSFGGTRPPVPLGHLRLHDAAVAVNIQAQLLGLYALSEVKVPSGRIDWVVLDPHSRRPLLAIEIEGREATEESLLRDRRKLGEIEVLERAVILHQVNHDLGPKGTIPMSWGDDYAGRARKTLESDNIHILMDTDLYDGALIRLLQPLLEPSIRALA